MKTLIGTLVLGTIGFGIGYFSNVVSGEFLALLFIVVWLGLRFKRATGIGDHIYDLEDGQQVRYDDWKNLGEIKGTSDERNRLVHEIDDVNEDMDNLTLIKW